LFSYLTLEDYVPKEHPLRPIREIVNAALRGMDEVFATMYADTGRDSIPPEQLLRGLLLQSLYGLRSERLLCEQLGYNMLFRCLGPLDLHEEPRPADRAELIDARRATPDIRSVITLASSSRPCSVTPSSTASCAR
jgi:hypothetical protein